MFYDNFLKACNSIGKTPSAALAEIGINKSAATRWRKGEMPTVANIHKIADYFGVSPEELKSETNLKVSSGIVKDTGELSAEALDVARAYERADKRTKDMVKLALEPFGLSTADEKAM